MDAAYTSDVYCSDSSSKGYAVHIASPGEAIVRATAEPRERLRFRNAGCAMPSSYGAQMAAYQTTLGDFDRWVDGTLSEKDKARIRASERKARLAPAVAAQARFDVHDTTGEFTIGVVDCVAFGADSAPSVSDELLSSTWRRLVVGAWKRPGRIHNL